MSENFKTITFCAKNKRQLNKIKKKLKTANNLDIIKIDKESIIDICSEDDIFKISKKANKRIDQEHKSPTSDTVIKRKTTTKKPKFIELDKFKKTNLKLSIFPPSPKNKKTLKTIDKPIAKPIAKPIVKPITKPIDKPIKKYTIPKKTTKNNFVIRPTIKTLHNKSLLNNTKQFNKEKFKNYFKDLKIKTTNKAPKKVYQDIAKMLAINKNHNLNII